MSQHAATKPIRDISPNGSRPREVLPEIAQGPSMLSRIKHILPHREDIVMPDGRQIKGGIVLHPIIATAILGAIVTVGLSIRSEMNWQHDQLITLRVEKVEADKRAADRAEDFSKRMQNIEAVQIVLGRDFAKLQEAQKARKEN